MGGEIIHILRVWMEGEVNNFIKVWLLVLVSLCYCYVAGKIVPKGKFRLFAVIPVVCLYLALPLQLHSMHLGGTTSFFIAWLANFKLLMFAVGQGPLSDPSLSLPLFLAIACLPIKIQQHHQHPPPPNSQKPSQNGHSKEHPSPKTSQKGQKSLLNYSTKCLLIALFLRVYDHSEYVHPKLILCIYCLHIYFGLEIILAMVAALARALLGLELEPQFNEPYLSTSLQDFWGRRWNIMVTRILRPTVYEPVLYCSTRILGRKWAPLPAIMGTFVVSALMHELIFYYIGRMKPTWEITWFFVLHGVCLMAEVAVKKAFSGWGWQVPRIVTGPLTVGFVMITGFWLFFPQFLRCRADARAFEEYALMGAFVKDVGRAFVFKLSNNVTTAAA